MSSSNKLVDQVVNHDKTRRVNFYLKNDGTFTYEQEMFSNEPEEMVWIPTGPSVARIFDTLETARREASGNISWLNNNDNT
jgi:hypothetical protein